MFWWSCLKDLLLDCASFCSSSPTQKGKVAHEHLCGLSFTSTTLSTDQNRIAFPLIHHGSTLDEASNTFRRKNQEERERKRHKAGWESRSPVSSICDGENMRTQITQGCASVLFHHMDVVQMRQPLERINCNQNASGICLPWRQKREVRSGTELQPSRSQQHEKKECHGHARCTKSNENQHGQTFIFT